MDTHIVVDTDVLIDFFAGRSPWADAVEKLLERDLLAVAAVTLFELACGAGTSRQLQDIELLARAARLIDLDGPAAVHAGDAYRSLRAKGQLLDISDILIAGCCLAAGLPLLTRNVKHFRRVEGLRLVDTGEILSR